MDGLYIVVPTRVTCYMLYIFFRSNHLNSLPCELTGCQRLREIFLSMNKFKFLPEVLYSLKNLENVFASDNQVMM